MTRLPAFIAVPTRALLDPDVSYPAHYLLTCLYLWADHETGVLWPQQRTIAEQINRTESWVSKYMRELVAAGHVTKRRRGRSWEYRVAPFRDPDTSPPDKSHLSSRQVDTWLTDNSTEQTSRTDQRTTELATTKPTESPQRPRDEIWDALEGIFGYRPTGNEARLWGRITALAKETGATPDDMRTRAELYLVTWPDASLTPAAYLKHFQWLGSETARLTGDVVREHIDRRNREMRRSRITSVDPDRLPAGEAP